jgi:predicted  nucleic acid-binding Zn-ribbon protein
MDIILLITASLTLFAVGTFMYLYLKNEKKNKTERGNDINEIKQLMSVVQTKIHETAHQQQTKIQDLAILQNEKFEGLAKEVKLAQDQANSKINSGFEQLQSENLNIQKDVKEKISEIETTFKDYSQKVQEALTKYTEDSKESKLETIKLKEQIQQELKNILTEIKAPLDLD